ncbi:MAG TPA: hypothetical protein VHX14_25120 [Thermoanaerobaculia bacterium]|jgi:hypothetical protein|nr:hypothetical protein [Thermoanaerobaculia bacterium]
MTTVFSAFLFFVATAAAPSRLPNACQLLSAREIAHVQGEAFRSAKLTESEADGLRVSQCFYALPSFTNSVSVDLMHGKTSAFWKAHFSNARAGRDDDADHDHDRDAAMKTAPPTREAEEEEHQSAVRKVSGVGDTAVWSGNRMSGALYVLKGNSIVRISVGGKGSEDEKIERSRKLAAIALRKL